MSIPIALEQPHPHSALRRLVARHPVAAFLIMAYTITSAFTLPPIRTSLGAFLLEFSLWDSLATIFGVALPAFLVMAALHGRAGIRDLASRSFRWRVGLRWYFVVLLGLPIAVVLCASAFYGLVPLVTLADKWPLLFTLILPDLLLRIVLLNLAEEIGWMGFLQARLQDGYGPLKAIVLTEIPFALWHVPFVLVDTSGKIPLALGLLGVLAIAQLFGRVVIMWLYNNTLRSVLLVGLFHAAHNTTINLFTAEFIPGPAETGFLITEGVVVVAAVLVLVLTRGRLSYTPNQEMDERRSL
jgi:membrane protease YdiL (CAAX protease family)